MRFRATSHHHTKNHPQSPARGNHRDHSPSHVGLSFLCARMLPRQHASPTSPRQLAPPPHTLPPRPHTTPHTCPLRSRAVPRWPLADEAKRGWSREAHTSITSNRWGQSSSSRRRWWLSHVAPIAWRRSYRGTTSLHHDDGPGRSSDQARSLAAAHIGGCRRHVRRAWEGNLLAAAARNH